MNRRKWLRRLVVVVSLGALGGGFVYRNRREPRAPTEIFKGITHGCERLEATEEGSGLLNWARIDLTAPGIERHPFGSLGGCARLAIPAAPHQRHRGQGTPRDRRQRNPVRV